MDPITLAIVAGITAGVTKLGEQVVIDAYNKLKDLFKAKFGARSKVVKAVKALEAKPNSAARKEILKGESAMAKADQDQELLQAAKALLDLLKIKTGAVQVSQNAVGNGN